MASLQTKNSAQPVHNEHDEMILVVKRSDFFEHNAPWAGLKQVNFDSYLSLIKNKKEFLPRTAMELDTSYKQIIPYLIFCHDDSYFLMQRTHNQTESRLRNKFSLGIGGHIRQEDLSNDSIFSWAEREFHEEVDYKDAFTIEPLGILNDDTTPVGQVHIGFVFLLKGTTSNISVKSELKSGQLVSLEECKDRFDSMETWSQIVYEFLLSHKKIVKE
jgi:predicted NUDIX family phosphoesterase